MEAGRVDRRRRVVDWSEAGQATKRVAWQVWMGEVLPLSLSLWLLLAGRLLAWPTSRPSGSVS
jgi:hypothetical protein